MRYTRPLAFLACALLALCTASCAPFFGEPMPSPAPQVKSIEAFQRDIEPAIVAARNELVTADTFRSYKNKDFIDRYVKEGAYVYSLHSRLYFVWDVDTDHIRETYNKHLLPLGFEVSEESWISNGIKLVSFTWTNEQYHAVVSATSRIGDESGDQTGTQYYTQENPSDDSTSDPQRLIDLPGRIPDWFDPNLPPAGQG